MKRRKIDHNNCGISEITCYGNRGIENYDKEKKWRKHHQVKPIFLQIKNMKMVTRIFISLEQYKESLIIAVKYTVMSYLKHKIEIAIDSNYNRLNSSSCRRI